MGGLIDSMGDARVRRSVACFVAVAIVAGLAQAAAAEVRRVEAVGIYGIKDSARRRVIPRDEAIARATWEGVSRVALELIGESPALSEEDGERPARAGRTTETVRPPMENGGGWDQAEAGRGDPNDPRLARGAGPAAGENEMAALEEALGEKMLPYTRSYRILEDRGEVPVLFAEDPDIDTEYVVVVEVLVDVDRVTAALERNGLISTASAGDGESSRLTLEVLGLSRYPAVERLVALLRGPLGASRVHTLEFTRERQVLGLVGPFGLEELAMRLAEARDPGLVLEPIGVDPSRGRLRIRARYQPEAL